MSFAGTAFDDTVLTEGVLARRCVGWLIDVVLVAVLTTALWWVLAVFGLLTLGLGFGAMAALPGVPFCYHFFSLLAAGSATPGQRVMDVTVRRDGDLGPPTAVQALAFTLVFYLTLMTSGVLLVVALFTIRHRALHDLVSGLVVVRARAMEILTGPGEDWNMGGGSSAS